MNAPFSQADRIGRFHTDLGKDALVLLRFTGTDAMNALFHYRVEALSTDPDVNFDDLLGTHGRVEIDNFVGEPVWFDGIITRAVWVGVDENGHRYDLELRPWTWLAGKRRNQRIFHEQSAPEIIEAVLNAYGALGDPHVENKLVNAYPTLEYTVQYRESDLDFVMRMMQRFGISFHFTHKDGSHTLVMTDSVDEHPTITGETRPYKPVDGHHQQEEEHFEEFRPERNITTGAYRAADYNFKTPNASMETSYDLPADYQQSDWESYDYPGDYLENDDGNNRVAPIRMEQERALDRQIHASGDIAPLKSGVKIGVTGDHLPSVLKETYLCIGATHSYVSDAYATGGGGGGGGENYAYAGRFVLQPVSAPMRPQRVTPVPVVQGPQTAKVGGQGEIDCDEYGRILVQFHWDLDGSYSMRCRVSQNWASRGWGGMIIPRIGMEVVVEFLEGDPDKPLVTGCVYNGANDPPYALPDHKTKSVFKTNTHQGSGFNELSFEDQANEELIYMHGQKDQEIVIQNDRMKTIGRDESNTIGQDRTQSVGRNETMNVGQDQTETIGRDVVYTVGQNQQESYGKDHVQTVGNIHKQDIGTDHLVTIGGNHEETVMGKSTLNVTQQITNNTGEHTLMAFKKFVIKGPGGKITIDPSGITMEAPMITLKGKVAMGGFGTAQVPTLQGAAKKALPLVEECEKKK